MRINIREILVNALVVSVSGACVAGVGAWAIDRGAFNHTTDSGQSVIVTTVPECSEEDGSGDVAAPCYWDGQRGPGGDGDTLYRVNTDGTLSYYYGEI